MRNNYMLTTRGVNSCVVTTEEEIPEQGKRPWTKYHVGLFDFDHIQKADLLPKIMDLYGINILWESSPNSYHLWNLTLREPEEIATLGLKMNADCKHVGHGLRRRKWVLRITGKFRDGETKPYKESPEHITTWYNATDRAQSRPHMALYTALTGKSVSRGYGCMVIGKTLNTEDYRTLTDRMNNSWEGFDGFDHRR
ncbi:MAG: hypothetical protein ACT6FG_05665 [Methanosarcinaceae archaeon]